MNASVTHVIVHSPEQVREIVAEAFRVADETGPRDEQWFAIFNKACDLLGQRYTFVAQPQAVNLADFGKIAAGNRQ